MTADDWVFPAAGSSGYLSILIAEAPVECALLEGIPRVEARLVSQLGKCVVCVWPRAKNPSITAARQRQHATSARKVMNAEERRCFLFMGEPLQRVENRFARGRAGGVIAFPTCPAIISFCVARV